MATDVNKQSAPRRSLVSVDTSAGKALAVLDAFAGPRAVLGVSEIAARVALPKSTVHRLLSILIDASYVRRAGDRYCLTGRAFELGNQVRVCRPNGLRERAIPFMAELFAQTKQTIHLAVLSGTDVLYVEKLFGHESTRCATSVGARRPAYATGLGKAILAFSDPTDVQRNSEIRFRRYTAYTIANATSMDRSLRRVREEGWATDFEESALGLTCLAVPIRSPRSHIAVAALSLSTVAGSVSPLRFTRVMVRAAEQLSAQLGAAAA